MNRLFCLGLGYSAQALARRLTAKGWTIGGTATTADKIDWLAAQGFPVLPFNGSAPSAAVGASLRDSTHVLVSAPPDADGDPVLRCHRRDFAEAPNLQWIGYLSTIGVYGDHTGAWIDETTPPRPTQERSRRRLDAERAWRALGEKSGRRVDVFRLAGIYGPGRSAIDALRAGAARRIVKPDQVFNRIHVEDIVGVLLAAIERPSRHAIYNVCDDEPAPPQDVVLYAAQLLGVEPPPEVPFADARLSDMAATFYAENKRVRNERIKSDLHVQLLYPTYREGLAAIARTSS